MNIIEKSSPNCDSRESYAVDMLVLHYTGTKTIQDAFTRLCDPAAEVSAHYMVDEDGTIYQLVPEDKRAWHAGKAPLTTWRGYTNVNQRSIGIEIVNPGHEFGYRPFPRAQMESVAQLCKEILARHNIPARNVVAHSDVAPSRKEDPGELFDWKWMAGQGIGLWPKMDDGLRMTDYKGNNSSSVIRHLSSYGYSTADLSKAILAFQRHFRPKSLTGEWDNECATLLVSLLEIIDGDICQ